MATEADIGELSGSARLSPSLSVLPPGERSWRQRSAAWLAVGHRRRLVIGWSVLVIAFGAFVAVFGLPYSEDDTLLWITAVLLVASLGDLETWRRGIIRDWLPLYAVLAVYGLLRGYASHTLWGPFYQWQIDFDRWIGFGKTPTYRLQHWLFKVGDLRPWDYAAWMVYMSHFFASFVVAGVLWKRNHARFRRYVTLFVSLTFIGYIVYVLYPAMPPWMAAETGNIGSAVRIIPVVWGHVGVKTAEAIFSGGSQFDNNVAAMPSLHAAYPMLICLFFWKGARPWVRVILVSYVLAMAFTLVYTGEHFVADEFVGWIFASGVYFIGSRILDRRAERRAAIASEPTPVPVPAPA